VGIGAAPGAALQEKWKGRWRFDPQRSFAFLSRTGGKPRRALAAASGLAGSSATKTGGDNRLAGIT